MRSFLTFAALVAVTPAALGQTQGGPATVAIAEVTSRGNAGGDLASEVNDALTDQLVGDGRFRVVERQQLAKVMKFSESLKVGSDEQVEAAAKQLARRLTDKLLGQAGPSAAPASAELVGDFDAGQVKDSAREIARALGLRFPKLTGKLVSSLPNGTASCSFSSGEPFKGEFFEISGRDEVTEQETRKGYFLLGAWSKNGCSGRFKREAGGIVEDGDTLTSMPLKIGVEAVEPGPGTQPELATLLASELRAALDSMPQFQVANDPQVTATGRVSGGRGRRSVDLTVVDKSGTVVQKVSVPASF
jgi:hypothetical protein